MKILVLANRDIASCCALNELLPKLHRSKHQLRCSLSAKVGSSSKQASALEILKHYEQDLFVETIFPQLEQANQVASSLSFNQLAEKYCDTSIVLENRINSPASIASLTEYSPDLIISIRYGVILKDPVIEIPRFGVINLHSGKLPDYRGVMATFWAMFNRESTISSTLHWIDSSAIDDGGIIGMTNNKLDKHKSYLENVLSLYPDGVELILDTVGQISRSENIATLESDKSSNTNYYTFPTANDIKKFQQDGFQLINEAAIQTLIHNKFTPA